ncbi:MAG: prolyl-tRNA synthetase associated domain-containing protein [Clostridia bacterium]|nr:prolyl-tRNA synthetase associated domain-containing protein [Clostridia bacterium]
MENKQAVCELLNKLEIPYIRVDHETANTIEDCKKIEQDLGCEICKNLFLCNRQQTDFYLLLMKGEKRFVTKDFSKTIGVSRLSFCSVENLYKYLNVTPGSASVLGLMFDQDKKVKLYIDKEVAQQEYIGVHPCDNTSTLKIRTKDILEKFLPYMNVTANIVEIIESE